MLGKYTFCHMESDMGPAVHLDAFLPSTFQPAFRSSGATVWSPGVQAAGGAKTHRGARWLKLYGIIYYIYICYTFIALQDVCLKTRYQHVYMRRLQCMLR